jgi:hypothetical protein
MTAWTPSLDHFDRISIFGPSAAMLGLVLAADIAFTGVHVWQEWRGERWPLWRVFGAVVGLRLPNAVGFLLFTVALALGQWALGLMAYAGWLPLVGMVPTSLAIWSLGAVLGARIADNCVSHWGLWLLHYRPNPGLSSTALYSIEAVVIVVAFRKGFGIDPGAAWCGLAIGAGAFIGVIPGLAVWRKFARSWQREPWTRGKPIPAWADT